MKIIYKIPNEIIINIFLLNINLSNTKKYLLISKKINNILKDIIINKQREYILLKTKLDIIFTNYDIYKILYSIREKLLKSNRISIYDYLHMNLYSLYEFNKSIGWYSDNYTKELWINNFIPYITQPNTIIWTLSEKKFLYYNYGIDFL